MIRVGDLFSGLGGNTEGAKQAGCAVTWAGNHWLLACDAYEANHGLKPACQDLHQQDWTQVPPLDLILASSACTGHTPARGKDRPQHDTARSTAWAVVSAVECLQPAAAIVENVPEFLQWALYPAWCAALKALGYAVAPHIVDAADCGVPQHRVRVLIALTRSTHPIVLTMPRRTRVPASAVIDFSAGRWSPIVHARRAVRTLERIAAGRQAHGVRFLAPYYASGSGRTGRDLARPIGTITTLARWAVIDGDRMRMVTVDETKRFMAFPDHYRLPANTRDAIKLLGNAVPPPMMRDAILALRAAA